MVQTARIKCPSCGVELDVKNSTGVTVKKIVCPSCGTSLDVHFKQPNPHQSPPKNEGDTIIDFPTGQIGKLCYKTRCYDLQIGRNTVGRKAASSTATIQIDSTDKYLSRSHIVIEVTRLHNGSIHTTLSNDRNKNPTYVGSQQVMPSDRIVLNNGDTIKMGQTTLTFVMDDDSDTTTF